jgi:hypothetical protein
MEIVKQYKQGIEMWTRKYAESKLAEQGYFPIREEELTEKKSEVFLFIVFAVIGLLIFWPLVLVGVAFLFTRVKIIKVTYAKKDLDSIVENKGL